MRSGEMRRWTRDHWALVAFALTAWPLDAAAGISCRFFNELKGHEDRVVALAFSPQGSHLASADGKGNVAVWDLSKEGKLIQKLKGNTGDQGVLAFSADEKYLFCGGDGKAAQMWSLAVGTKVREFSSDQPVRSLALSRDGRTLLAGGTKGGIAAWDVNTGRSIKTLKEAHDKAVLVIGFTGDETFRSIGEDRKLKSWEISRSSPIATGIDDMSYEVMTSSCNPSMDVCAVGAVVVRAKKGYQGIKEYHNIYVKDGISWAQVGTLKGHDLRIRALSFAPQGDYLASGGDGKTVNLWNLNSGQIEADIRSDAEVSALSISPDGRWLATGNDSASVSLYELKGVPAAKEVPDTVMAAEPDLTPGQKYAVVVGLSRFRAPDIAPLQLTVADAKAFYEFLTSPQGGGFPKDNVRLLLDAEATRVNIEDAFKNFLPRNAGRDDTVVMFFAGHGTPDIDLTGRADDGMEKYLVPYDADLEKIAATCIPMSNFTEIFGSIRSRRVILFLDSCFSGGGAGKHEVPDALARTCSGPSKSLRGITVTSHFINQLTEGPSGYGKVLITASQANEQALELPELGHGLFTYYLLEGLSGKADKNGDGYVVLNEAYDYLEERVAAHSRRAGGKQTPMMAGAITGKILLATITRPE
jgi:WD40 repeat protein